MLDFEHIETLEEIADYLKERWQDEEFCHKHELNLIQTYAQVCTAIVQADANVDRWIEATETFVQIGEHIIRKSDILRVKEDHLAGTINISIRDQKTISIEDDSPEAKAFLKWLKFHSEVLKLEEEIDDQGRLAAEAAFEETEDETIKAVMTNGAYFL